MQRVQIFWNGSDEDFRVASSRPQRGAAPKEPHPNAATSRFKDIVFQDGSSFALEKRLRDGFPDRFTTVEQLARRLP
jgi:hypothetical protein